MSIPINRLMRSWLWKNLNNIVHHFFPINWQFVSKKANFWRHICNLLIVIGDSDKSINDVPIMINFYICYHCELNFYPRRPIFCAQIWSYLKLIRKQSKQYCAPFLIYDSLKKIFCRLIGIKNGQNLITWSIKALK